jgi:hypothetical protein
MLADEEIVAQDADVAVRLEPPLRQRQQRNQRGLRRVGRSHGDGLPPQIFRGTDGGIGADHDHRGEAAIGVTHDDGLSPAADHRSEPLRLDPGQR